MGHKLAIDFGTTNSVAARWNAETSTAEIIPLRGYSISDADGHPPLVPSLVYAWDAGLARISIGQAVRDQGLDMQSSHRLFRNFKRGILTATTAEPRSIDGLPVTEKEVGGAFMKALLAALPYAESEIDQLVLTAPVVSFESYVSWLGTVVEHFAPEKVHIVDESTAAALGYLVKEPGALVLVFDFGGGTLDLSLVQLPEGRENTGGLLQRLLKRGGGKHTAKVIAKSGRIIGGSDIDQWLLAEVLRRTGVTIQALGLNYVALLTACESAKISLSTVEAADIAFTAEDRPYQVTVTRAELEDLLGANGFSAAIRRIVDKGMHVARQRGIFKEDITYVLLVGGTSLMPIVQHTLRGYFSDMAVRADKPFTAVAEGALQVAAGYGLDDYLAHGYGIRHLVGEQQQYDEIIPMGARYPSPKPLEVVLGAAHDGQDAIEFVIGEIDGGSVAMLEVIYEDGEAVFVAQGGDDQPKIVALNEDRVAATLARLMPPGTLGDDRLKVSFRVDDRRQLRLSVHDLKTNAQLLDDVTLATLR